MARAKAATAPEAKDQPDVVFEYERNQKVRTKVGTARVLNRRVFEGEPLYHVLCDDMKLGLQYLREEEIFATFP